MAWVWDSEVLNCPYVNQPINAEQSHITSALISPFACEDMGRIWVSLLQGRGMLYSDCLSRKEREEVVKQKEDETWNREKQKMLKVENYSYMLLFFKLFWSKEALTAAALPP